MTQTNTLDYRNAIPSTADEPEHLVYGLTPTAWLKIAIVAVLMVATFRFNLVRLWLKTNPFSGEPNWRHAICVPLIGLYYLYVNRDELLAVPARTSWSGLGILIFGILLFVYGIYPGQNDFVKDFGMIVALFGVVTLLCGWRMMKIAWFPIVFLICAIPWPDLIYSYVASPLQHLAASVAVGTLRFANVVATNNGTKILITGKDGLHTLNVAEACAGLRSLMTFVSVGGAIAFLSSRAMWQKILITASAIPIAVFCNVMRVTGQGFLDLRSHELSEGFAHQFVGIVMLVPGFFLILLVGWVLDKLFIEEADEKRYDVPSTTVRPKQQGSWSLPNAARRKPAVVKPKSVPAAAPLMEGSSPQGPATEEAKSPVFGPKTQSLPKTTIPANSVAAPKPAAATPARAPAAKPSPAKTAAAPNAVARVTAPPKFVNAPVGNKPSPAAVTAKPTGPGVASNPAATVKPAAPRPATIKPTPTRAVPTQQQQPQRAPEAP